MTAQDCIWRTPTETQNNGLIWSVPGAEDGQQPGGTPSRGPPSWNPIAPTEGRRAPASSLVSRHSAGRYWVL